MNIFRIRATGELVTEQALRASLPFVLPQVIDADACNQAEVDPVLASPPPVVTEFQRVLPDGAVQDGLGNWVQAWRVENWSQEEIDTFKAATIDARWEAIKAERDGARTRGGVTVAGHWFHTDTDSRIKWLGLKDSARDLLAAGGAGADQVVVDGAAVAWKTMAGSFVPVTVQLALDVVEATKVLDKRLFTVAEQHNAALRAAADPTAYDYSTGWPARYGE